MPGSYDIGPKIGMDGEAEFRKSLQNINQQLKTLGSEMKAVTSAFDAGDSSEEKLAAQTGVLNKQIDAQEKKLQQLQKGLDASAQKYGENDTRTLKWAQAVNNATADLNRMRSQLSQAERGMDDLGDTTEDAADAADDVGGRFGSFQVALGNLVSNGIQAAISAVGNLIRSIINLDEATEEYRKAQGRLTTAYENAGLGANVAQYAYKEFYSILGDTDTATEASQLLAQLATNGEDVAYWTHIAAGVSGTFGDSLPIESLIEAANETAKTGTVTGTLADALNWGALAGETFGVTMRANTEANKEWNTAVQDAKSAEDYFNLALQECSTESERQALIMNTLMDAYDSAADSFWANNEALVASRDAQAQMDAALATVGEAVANVKNEVLTGLTPALTQFVDSVDWQTLSADIGSFISEVLSGLMPTLTQLVNSVDWKALSKDVSSFLQTIIGNGPTIISVISGIGAGFVTWKITSIISALVTSIQALIPALTGAKTAQTGLNTAMSANPIGIVITAVAALVTAIITLWNTNEDFRSAVETVWGAISSIISDAADAIINFFTVTIPNAWESVKSAISSAADTVINFFTVTIPSAVNRAVEIFLGIPGKLLNLGQSIIQTIVDGLSSAWESIVEAGKEIVRGILDGIKSMGTWLKNQITTFCTGVLDGFLSFFGIHSPSRLMRDRVGVPIIQGVALGMRKGLPEVRETAGQIGSAIEEEISKVNGEIARMEQEETDRQAAEELAEHKKKLAELYDELGRAEWDERQDVLDEIAELQADWDAKQAEEARKAEKEAAQGRLEELEAFQERYQDTLDELEEAYQDSYDEITGMQADMAEALAGYGDLFTEADGVVELGDLRSQVNDIRRYGEALKELEGRGISDSLMSEITGMSVEDALAYTEELLGLTDRQYEEYMALWETKQAEAQRVAQEFYASELRALSDEYVNKIPEAVSGLKNEMADLGMDSALGLAEGFASMETSIGNIFTETIQRAVDAAKAAMGIHSPSTVWRDQVGAMMAQGLADGFTQRLRAVSGNMTAAIPSAADQFGSIAAGMVNGVQTAVAGGGNYRIEIPIIINGREFSRAILPDLRAVEKSNPEVVSGV